MAKRERRRLGVALVVGVALALASVQAGAEDTAQKKPQTKCPIMGNEINKEVYLDYQGQRVYFCCPGCPANFKKDAEKYMEAMAEQNILLESVQKACPVSGEPINKEIYSDYKGRRVYFCGKGCQTAFQATPEAFLKKLDAQPSSDEEEAPKKKGGCGGKCGGGC